LAFGFWILDFGFSISWARARLESEILDFRFCIVEPCHSDPAAGAALSASPSVAKAVQISGRSWGLRSLLCGKALPFRPKSPKCYCFPPREGCTFRRRKTGCIENGSIGKAQPFPSTDGRSRRLYPIARIVIWTSPVAHKPEKSLLRKQEFTDLQCRGIRQPGQRPGLPTGGFLCGLSPRRRYCGSLARYQTCAHRWMGRRAAEEGKMRPPLRYSAARIKGVAIPPSNAKAG
jgi:hypothetical protein